MEISPSELLELQTQAYRRGFNEGREEAQLTYQTERRPTPGEVLEVPRVQPQRK